ncbi:MAG: hypothetical protein PHQ76_01135 [Caldisericia bacterium]|nr:hypothetical protein [Caldisericia bacterium]
MIDIKSVKIIFSKFRNLSKINNVKIDREYNKNNGIISTSKRKNDLKIVITIRYRKARSLNNEVKKLM